MPTVEDNVKSFCLSLGSLVRNERRMAALTQQELANFAGLDRAFISLVESGKVNPSILTVAKIAQAFGFNLDTFLEKACEKCKAARCVQLKLNLSDPSYPEDPNPAEALLKDPEKVKEVVNG